MISDNQMISGRQASWIFMLDMLAAGLFSLTAAKEQASSLTMLVGSLLTIGLVLIYYKASFCMFDQYEKKTGIRLSEQKLPGILCLLWLIFYLAGLIWALRCDRRQNTGCVWPCAAHHFSDGSVDLWRRKRYGGAGENVRTHGMADLSAVDPSFYIWSAAGDPKRLLAVSDG